MSHVQFGLMGCNESCAMQMGSLGVRAVVSRVQCDETVVMNRVQCGGKAVMSRVCVGAF